MPSSYDEAIEAAAVVAWRLGYTGGRSGVGAIVAAFLEHCHEVTVTVDTYGTVYAVPEMSRLLGLGSGPVKVRLAVVEMTDDE